MFITVPDTLAIVALMACLGSLAAWGISQSVWVAALMTLAEIGGLLLIVWVAKPGAAAMLETLELPVTVHACRAEELLPGTRFETLVARAVGPLWKMLKWYLSA